MAKSDCPYCQKTRELTVVPFNEEEGVKTVCEECFRDVASFVVAHFGVVELRKLDQAGYFSEEHLGFLKATEGLTNYVNHLKLGRPKPFAVTGSLIVADECS